MLRAGRWVLGEVITRHRHARVHATDEPRVMVAVLEPEADALVLEGLIAEARSFNDAHDGTVTDVVDAGGLDDGTVYLAMELLAGQILMELLNTQPRSAPDEVTRVGLDLLDGIAAVHARGFIHGKVRPGNVMIASDGRARLLQVGLAMLVATRNDMQHVEGGMRGWAPYQAPEQIEAGPPDPRTDLYAAGAILYELATGVPAFDGESLPAILHAHVTTRPLPPRKRVPELPRSLERVILRALERDPADRFTSANEMRAALVA